MQRRADQVLKDIFGFPAFRPNQRDIVEAILDRRDAFVVMPTGGGKSLCYQLPAHIMNGTCMVVSPLISLMKDQVDAAQATGLRAAYLNSSQAAAERADVLRRLVAGGLDLIYVSPERFAMASFVQALKRVTLAFAAIDEAHCISEWGHDFRPEYLNLSQIATTFPGVPIAAFTATATLTVQHDIIAKLGLRSPHIVRASFNRPNLFYQVVGKENGERQILDFVRAHPNEAGIVYRTTRKSVEATASSLASHGIRALPYHAGLDDATRVRNQDAFNRDEIDVIVATIAFGMGIDKSNVRYVLHGDLPKNVESYYQETGRSGRDGEPAHCLLLFGYGDIPKIRYFLDRIPDEQEKKHALHCLNSMVHYATVHACRRKALLHYFGEPYPPGKRKDGSPEAEPRPEGPCCDVCSGDVERVEATRDAQILMSAIARTGERFGVAHIVDVVVGADTQRIRELGHDRIKTYGVGREKDKRHWRMLLDNLLAQGLVAHTEGPYPGLRLLEPKARQVLFEDAPVYMLCTKEKPKRRRLADAGAPYDENLFDVLRNLRKDLALRQGVPPFVIFSDRTLHEMARRYPTTPTALSGISGVGAAKLSRYGAEFLAAITAYRKSRT